MLLCTAWKVSKYGVFFWSVFSCIWIEHGDLRSKSQYSVQIQENTDQEKLRIWTLFTQWWTVVFWISYIKLYNNNFIGRFREYAKGDVETRKPQHEKWVLIKLLALSVLTFSFAEISSYFSRNSLRIPAKTNAFTNIK